MKPCECDVSMLNLVRRGPPDVCRDEAGRWIHAACGGYFPCEFSWMDGEDTHHPATTLHIDYLTCEKHERHAVDNVSCR